MYRWVAVLIGSLVVVVGAGTVWLYLTGLTVKHGGAMLLSTLGLYRPIEPEMVKIDAGEFWMGASEDERMQGSRGLLEHRVRIEGDFAIGKFEVTFDEYDRFSYATGRRLKEDYNWGRGRRPIIGVTWRDARDYAEWLSDMTGKRFRLPTEAEWEYAARAGTTTTWYWGNNPDEACEYSNFVDQSRSQWYGGEALNCDDGNVFTADVGFGKANDYGLHNMLGNVWEWVQDCWNESRNAAAGNDDSCESRVLRGGGWKNHAAGGRAAERLSGNWLDATDDDLGFRLAQDF
jgi:formylglycine-generating enzyme required for sulfatase activity